MNMKKIYLFISILISCINLYAQNEYKLDTYGKLDAYTGTWVYQNKDTIFKIHLSECTSYFPQFKTMSKYILGSYSLSINGKTIDDYRAKLPDKIYVDATKKGWSDNICIEGSNVAHRDSLTPPPYIGFTFYDKRKRHFNGEGMWCGQMKLLSPDSLYFSLDEKAAIWHQTEGTDIEVEPIGFSVPYNIIMRKEK